MVDTNAEDFRISEINGERLITFMAHSKAYVLNPDYSIRTTKNIETWGTLNTHELNFVNNGTQVIVLRNGPYKVPVEAAKTLIGMDSSDCAARYDGFSVLDVTQESWPPVFDWHSLGRIDLEESTYIDGEPESRCRSWDFV